MQFAVTERRDLYRGLVRGVNFAQGTRMAICQVNRISRAKAKLASGLVRAAEAYLAAILRLEVPALRLG